MKCPACKSEMKREATAFVKCTNKKCTHSTYGIQMSEAKPVRGVGHLLVKRG